MSSFETQLSADPLFQQLLSLENALTKVKNEISQNPQDHPDFKMDQNGYLVEVYEGSQSESEKASSELNHENHENHYDEQQNSEDEDWLEAFVDKMANGRETEHITLEKTKESSLGFSVVGLESDNRGELGIFVQEIQPGTICDMDGRLKESDQILVINGKPLGPNVSHTEAIAALQG